LAEKKVGINSVKVVKSFEDSTSLGIWALLLLISIFLSYLLIIFILMKKKRKMNMF